MQRPRRTSEFHDDPGAVHRQYRSQQKSMVAPSPNHATGGTAVKFSARKSRIAVRSSSLDRGGTNNAYLTVPGTTSRGGTTQETPSSSKKSTNRVLFTAEKNRGGNSAAAANGPLHNDKKWVQEQTQRITEYLQRQPTIGGFGSDFLQRGLRQMSIKQFVAIVNFFLNHIWGKRYVVGNNHVEDIIQILQKLQYPHAVNKSWLKTPNTQHSFGNVIVLFDYLMDFVPPFTDDVIPQAVDYFELQEPQEQMNGSRMNEDLFQMPDLEFQREFLLNTEEGFMLWDTQMDDEFNSLQQETCNLLIKKSCNFPDAAAVYAEIHKLEGTLKSLQDQTHKDEKEMIRLKSKLSEEFDFLCEDLKLLNGEYHSQKLTLKELNRKKVDVASDVENMEREVSDLQEAINKQVCSVEQRDQLMLDQQHLEHMLAIEERTLRDLESRNHNQQVLYARVLKQFTDRVESFNALMREIAFSDVPKVKNISSEELQLPLRPDEQQLQKLIPLLGHIKESAQQSINETRKKTSSIQQRAKLLIDEIDTKLEIKLNSLRLSNSQATEKLENLNQHMKEEVANMHMTSEQLHEQLSSADKLIEELQTRIEQKRSQIENMKEANEFTMQQAEAKHERYLSQRRAFLESYDSILEESVRNDVLKNLTEQVELQEKQLEDLRREFQTEIPTEQ